MPSRPPFCFLLFVLGLLPLAAAAQPTPHQLIGRLGVDIRQAIEDPRRSRAPEDVERAVAQQIEALARSPEGAAALTKRDAQGRTPLMLAVAGAYPLVVKALLADPGVKRTINESNAVGETAWMLAKTAPAMTLMACQPGALTLDRYPLLPPYLARMTVLLKAKTSPVVAIVQALEESGARIDPAAAARAWLARCPNAAPELRQALAGGDLLNTLVNDALQRQTAFNRAHREGSAALPQKPPVDMRFITAADGPPEPHLRDASCGSKPRPTLRGALNWSGTLLFKVAFATRAGVVEVADFTVLSAPAPAPHVVDHFRGALIQALAGYQCEGDHVFEQEFQFKVQ